MLTLSEYASVNTTCFKNPPSSAVSEIVVSLRAHTLINAASQGLETLYLPMLRHLPKPLHAGGLYTW